MDFAQIWVILKLTVPRFQFYYRTAVPAYGSRDNRPASLVTVPRFLTGTGNTLARALPCLISGPSSGFDGEMLVLD